MSLSKNTISPIDGSVYVQRDYANQEQIDTCLEVAHKAQKVWQALPLSQRKALCNDAVQAFVANKDAIAKELCWQMGRPIRYAAGEVSSFAERAEHMIAIADSALAPLQQEEKAGFIRYIRHEPVGVVLVIAPWNYPLHTPINVIVPALLAGNSVVLKHSSQTPLCAERIFEAFASAGLPEGVLQYLHLQHDATEALVSSGRVNHVAFTGSVAAGHRIEQAAAGQFIGVGLELGGKDPAYIRADADLNYAIESTVDGAFFNSGQSCCGLERIYVHEAVYDAFLEGFLALTNNYQLGRSDDPETTLGPLVRASAANFVRQQIAEAVTQGAVAHINPKDFPMDKIGTPYMAPQVLSLVDHSMRVMTEESFGPVVGIMKVANDDEAIKLMNDSDLGLTAAIYTQDIDQGVVLGEKLETGTFFINRCDYLDPSLAWTGVKNTGRGCTLSSLGFGALTRPKSYHIKTI
ncbi:MAG: acyl-CoA reductase-like NAD-dependent aldehyde dehydrogenase [Oceanospirillaceae bacterium]|jgi:acyl-CoA reductase-like NAD-dependent aldehyde dehydrogenase